ncbi:DNA-binding transcriptional LysR family regulator [Neisseria perflava]|uniref:LysR family transcriptional regulator n=1 Tax=Neisseria perflava TaxID=33053 RepID=UPI00209F2E5B|nr:LysR family transcriptional regulator [Neisseria perflava]MCP1772271.1 DNA-binding transcriptional LysR family regulator [Neisseria perflava]
MENIDDLKAFLLVARTGSFTKAAAQIGVSQSALSYTVRMLEQRLDIKLLERTTRSVSTTAAGEALRQKIEPLLTGIDEAINDLNAAKGALGGTIRINGNEHSLRYVLQDKLLRFSAEHPKVTLEAIAENRFSDIIGERFDMGIRLGSNVAKDMIAVKVSGNLIMQTAASPGYLATHGTPKTPFDLSHHRLLAYRLPTLENLMMWEFRNPKRKQDKHVKIQPDGGFISNNNDLLIAMAKQGKGLVWLPQDVLAQSIADGTLVGVLDNWAMNYGAYYLYYPSRRADSALFQAVVAALRETD